MTPTWDVFLAQLTLIYTAHIEQENNVDDDFTKGLRTVLISVHLSTLDKYFLVVWTILISNEFFMQVIWVE